MSAIFISYTSRDVEGRMLAERVVEWLRGWGYRSLFRDQDLREGIPAGSDWRRILHGTLAQCQAMVSVCSPSYHKSEWCTAELAVALDRGKTVFPLQVGKSKVPLLLRNSQAIALEDLIVLTAEAEPDAKERLRLGLERRLSWRDKMPLPPFEVGPFPGLKAYDERLAALFFGRDKELYRVLDEVQSLEAGSDFLLLYGASGCGKSSLLKAGLVPELRRVSGDGLLVVDPFRPDAEPLQNLASQLQVAMERDGLTSKFTSSGTVDQLLLDLNIWRRKQQRQGARVLLPIDQFEDIFRPYTPTKKKPMSEGDRFLAFLLELLNSEGRVLVVATMRTDFLAMLEAHSSYEAGLRWQGFRLEPMPPAFYVDVIEGPCKRLSLVYEPGLKEQMIVDTGSGDALPLLAFTLEAMWKRGVRRLNGDGSPHPGKPIDFLWDDYNAIGTVRGSVRKAAERVEKACTTEQLVALKSAFLDHLLRWNEEGDSQVVKQKALRSALPPESLPVVDRMIDRERLLVSDAGTVEIAHEALMLHWPTLVRWIDEGKGALLQRLRVKRLIDDLRPETTERQRRQALEQLAALVLAGNSEKRIVEMHAKEALSSILMWINKSTKDLPDATTTLYADSEDAALLLALIGAEEPLWECIANTKLPVTLRRRSAESLGLLAKDSCNRDRRQRIVSQLNDLLRSDAIDVLVVDSSGWEDHDRRMPLLQGAARGLQLALSAELPPIGFGPGLVMPMLTITAIKEQGGLHLRTSVVDVPVWKLQLTGDTMIELVRVPGGEYQIGSPLEELGRDSYSEFKPECAGVDIEQQRHVIIPDLLISRFPVTQSQWNSVWMNRTNPHSSASSYFFGPSTCWEIFAENGSLPVDSITFDQARQFVQALNEWLESMDSPLVNAQFSLECQIPTEAIWEISCRSNATTPFHFGDTIDYTWANLDFSEAYGLGRTGLTRGRTSTVGSYGLVNSWGIADLHGQVLEWCCDTWNTQFDLEKPCEVFHQNENPRACYLRNECMADDSMVLRGGSWFDFPLHGRSAFRDSILPGNVKFIKGLRLVFAQRPVDGMSK